MLETIQEAFGTLQGKLVEWVRDLILHLPNFLVAVLIVAVGWYLARYAYGLVNRLVLRASGSQNVSELLASITRVLVVGAALFIGLSVIGLSSVVASGLAGAGIVGLAIGFALQDPLANLFSGIMMSVKELYRVGDLVETNGHLGVIQGITLRTTLLKSLQGQEVAIPNKDVLQSALVNYTTNRNRRVDLTFGVSYGDDLARVREVTKRAIEAAVDPYPGKDVQVFWTEFGDSSINGVVRFWQEATSQADFLAGRSRAIEAIKSAFDREDIMIPFPIRTLDFGIRGGEKLSEMALNVHAASPENRPHA